MAGLVSIPEVWFTQYSIGESLTPREEVPVTVMNTHKFVATVASSRVG